MWAIRYHQLLSLSEERNTKLQQIDWELITFSEENENDIIFPNSDPMIIRDDIAYYDVGRILVDTGNSVNVLFVEAFNAFEIGHQYLNNDITFLLSFLSDVVQPINSIQLHLAICALL